MSKKIYVGNLSYNIDDHSLLEMFSTFGEVISAKIVIDRDSGRSKGFGFVDMASDSDANSAIDKMNGSTISDRTLNVSEAKPMIPNDRRPQRNNFNSNRSRY